METILRQPDHQDMGVAEHPNLGKRPLPEGEAPSGCMPAAQRPPSNRVTRMLGTAFPGILGWARGPTGRDARPPRWHVGIIRHGEGWLGQMS